MNAADFDAQFSRLTAHFHLPADASRETLAMDWFRALEHHHIDALDAAITELTRTATDRYWPALGKITELIRARQGRYDRAHGKCDTCHGATWIPAQAWKSNGMIYDGLQRCPDCGIPAPQDINRRGARELTATEAQAHYSGQREDYMPDFAKAKPWKSEAARLEHKRAMREAFERLRIKLFGHSEDAA